MRRRTGLIALLAADTVAALGIQMSVVAIPWLVLVMTNSPAKMGLAAGAEIVCYVLSGIFAAPVADRFGTRRTAIAAETGSAAALATVALLPHLHFGVLLVLVAVSGGLRGVGDRVKHVMMRPMAEIADAPMIRVTSVYESLTRVAMLVGAPLAGVLISAMSAAHVVGLTAVTFAGCALLVTLFVRPPDAGPAEAREPYLTALRGGVRTLLGDRMLVTMTLILFASNLFTQAAVVVFVPLWVRDVAHTSTALGLVDGAFAGGVLLGSMVFTLLATRVPQYLAFTLGAILGGAPRLLVLGLSDNLAVVMGVTLLSGVAMCAVNPVYGAALYRRVPAALQTRVFGLVTAVCFSGIPLGGILAGWAVPGFGLTGTVLSFGVVFLVVSLVPLLGVRGRDPLGVPERETAAA
ncbi:putative drug antiporter protein precursor [Longispora fulva]|uniref:Multidrug efflux pump Tap n=1 Tax=Longispora fulva TaxID=619741 RepID=A0A8J7GIP8_9ACTN|nr:MFS transporter [Longispora fulva]MBG6137452.1 MFS family permease [Longispora fulva]GIG61193.1 putative drug antiporter protein precursor [Longispora fulva]